uniref:CCZ1/INTU/HSP4 first Longin domain-containing protein n=1 Tax=Panstrongylus megistus TaxID=65343 RepID=A0A069DZG1_9HEMI
MSKELLIIFLYDCELCKKEEDDPQDAIVYFYPTWVNNEQRHALCSQLMGVTQFCTNAFTIPKLISLQSGKFSIKKIGRFALCVGTDRNIPDMVLQTRLNVLYKLLRLFHYDIESLQTTLDDDDDNLSDKLSQLLQVYLPILQYATNTFGNIPTMKLPKSTSTVYLQAIQLLESFQEISGVLGGTILYQNKVVATQLSCDLTKQLVVSDPYRIKLPAQNVITPFHLPVGVQLLNIYIESSEVEKLRLENEELLQIMNEVKLWRAENENQANNINKPAKLPKEIPTAGCNMKRDTSRIFTVPEESGEIDIDNEVPDLVKDAVRARHLARIEAVAPSNFVIAEDPVNKKSLTTEDLLITTNNVPIRYFSLGLPKLDSEWCDSPVKVNRIRPYYNTICDPVYPLFKANGLPASHLLHQTRLTGHYENLKSLECTPKKKNSNSLLGSQGVPITPLMAKLTILAQEESQLETPSTSKTPSCTTKVYRGLSKTPVSETKKLSEENLNEELSNKILNSENIENDIKNKSVQEDLTPLGLYVFGENSTSVLLLIELSTATNPESIHSLWERSMNYLKKLETQLHKCLDHIPLGPSGEYSYAVVDPSWGPIERGGAYQPHQLELLTTLHYTLNERSNITDILVRGEDTISYGYQCGENQIFYQQNCSNSGGLPTPADLMGVLPLKAKRTLERDHGIVLL